MIWNLVLLACFLAAIFTPPARLGVCAVLFCVSAVLPKILAVFESVFYGSNSLFAGEVYFAVSSLTSVIFLLILNSMEPLEKYSVNLQVLLIVDILLNTAGFVLCHNGLESNSSFYEWVGVLYYMIACYFIYERRDGGSSIFDSIASWFRHNRTLGSP